MDESGVIGALAAIAILFGVGVVGTASYLYVSDYALRADVLHTDCVSTETVVTVQTKQLGIRHDVLGLPNRDCSVLKAGDDVAYHIRTKHTTIYRNGSCFYDSTQGMGCGASSGFLL